MLKRRTVARKVSLLRPMRGVKVRLGGDPLDSNTTFLGCQVPPAFMARVQCAVGVRNLTMREAITAGLMAFVNKVEKEIEERGHKKGYEILLTQKAILLNMSVDEIKLTCAAMERKIKIRVKAAWLKAKEYDKLLENMSK